MNLMIDGGGNFLNYDLGPGDLERIARGPPEIVLLDQMGTEIMRVDLIGLGDALPLLDRCFDGAPVLG